MSDSYILSRRALLTAVTGLLIPRIAQASTLDLQVYTEKGTQHDLRDYTSDRPFLLNIWSQWCAPCIKEMPQVNLLAKKVSIVGIAIMEGTSYDPETKEWEDFQRVRNQLDIGYPNVLMYKPERVLLQKEAPFKQIPTFILCDKDGKITHWQQGSIELTDKKKELEQKIEELF
ncbi:TlpA family protein disulfide reductase [Candidatus Woesearchaeota archaeon]|nr:TlpA family protein disulfide reductase [Candidatus Woesearchaeota archaeon]